MNDKYHPAATKISHYLRDARHAAGLTLRELARRAGTSHSTIASYEQGRKIPSAEVFLRLLNCCQFDLSCERSPRLYFADPAERGEELAEVLQLAEQFPARHAKEIQFPRFGQP